MRTLILAAILLSSLALTACETLKGVGRDISNTGEAIDRRI
jgi:predicted small secreted protein